MTENLAGLWSNRVSREYGPNRQEGGDTSVPGFEDLLAEGQAVDVAGWDFSWFEGRATEERPPWGYAKMLGERMSALASVPDAAAMDLQTRGGEPGSARRSCRSRRSLLTCRSTTPRSTWW
jgi:hypothetical protein